jgi:hypothetical protein
MTLITSLDDERLGYTDKMIVSLELGDQDELMSTYRDSLRAVIAERDAERKLADEGYREYAALRADLAAANARFTAPIVCICGSTRFKQAWISENARLTGEGNIVLAVGLWGHHERVFPDSETKKKLDELHFRKIDLCEWVWVLDIGGYIGESTRNEIAYAEAHGKPIRYLSKEIPYYTEPVDPLAAALAQLAEYKRLLDEEVSASTALTAELNDIAAALGIFRHPDEKEQLANCAEKMREEIHHLRKVAYGGCTCGCEDFHECGKD